MHAQHDTEWTAVHLTWLGIAVDPTGGSRA